MPIAAHNLKSDSTAITRRVKIAGARMDAEIELYLDARGWPPMAQWSLAELVNGAPQDPRTGTFARGRRPGFLQELIEKEVRRRRVDAVRDELAKYVPEVVAMLGSLIHPESDADHSVKVAAGRLILEHVIGKPTQHVEAEVKAGPFEFIAGAIVGPDGEDLNPTSTTHI